MQSDEGLGNVSGLYRPTRAARRSLPPPPGEYVKTFQARLAACEASYPTVREPRAAVVEAKQETWDNRDHLMGLAAVWGALSSSEEDDEQMRILILKQKSREEASHSAAALANVGKGGTSSTGARERQGKGKGKGKDKHKNKHKKHTKMSTEAASVLRANRSLVLRKFPLEDLLNCQHNLAVTERPENVVVEDIDSVLHFFEECIKAIVTVEFRRLDSRSKVIFHKFLCVDSGPWPTSFLFKNEERALEVGKKTTDHNVTHFQDHVTRAMLLLDLWVIRILVQQILGELQEVNRSRVKQIEANVRMLRSLLYSVVVDTVEAVSDAPFRIKEVEKGLYNPRALDYIKGELVHSIATAKTSLVRWTSRFASDCNRFKELNPPL